MKLDRRAALAALSAALAAPLLPARAEEVVEIGWRDLIPDGGSGVMMEALKSLGGVVEHGALQSMWDPQEAAAVTREYDGRTVRIPGYMVPLDYEGTGVTAFLLVPYVGACVHVPPPPPNQLVFVTTAEPWESDGLFEPVWVQGMFGAAAAETMLAEVGYALSADLIEPYE